MGRFDMTRPDDADDDATAEPKPEPEPRDVLRCWWKASKS